MLVFTKKWGDILNMSSPDPISLGDLLALVALAVWAFAAGFFIRSRSVK
jgi:hypothetical protein